MSQISHCRKCCFAILVRWKPAGGPFADPATTARRARNAPAGADLGRAMSGATARGRDQHTVRGERAPRSRIALERERGTDVYARKNIFRGKVQNECFY